MQVGDTAFPEANWTDMAAAFTAAWLSELRRISSGEVQNAEVHFYDGPFSVLLVRTAPEKLRFELLNRRTNYKFVQCIAEAHFQTVLRDAIDTANAILAKASAMGWLEDNDTQMLASELHLLTR